MKHTEIHNGLENEEIRDFISNQISKIKRTESIDIIKEEIKKLEKRLKEAEKFNALQILIEHFGYEEFDISDYITKEDGRGYRNFIGTQYEYDELMTKLENK